MIKKIDTLRKGCIIHTHPDDNEVTSPVKLYVMAIKFDAIYFFALFRMPQDKGAASLFVLSIEYAPNPHA
jgi:hypothetical protein